MYKISEAVVLLEKWTCRRKQQEMVELLKASGQLVVDDDDERNRERDIEDKDEFYSLLDDLTFFDELRLNFPICTHKMLLELALKIQSFEWQGLNYPALMDSFVLRSKYRHFFDPPLV